MEPDPGDDADLALAARQASWQFAILTIVGLLAVANQPNRPVMFVLIVLFAVSAAAVRLTPATVWGPRTIIALTVALFVGLGLSTWSTGDRAIVTGAGFSIAFVWMGLHQRARIILVFLVPATLTYWLALLFAGTGMDLAGSALITVPVAALVGVLISRVVAESRRAKAAIKAEERWRAAIMATLAHDVRSPLTSIIGALEILGDDSPAPAHRSLVESASRQAQRILRLAAGLLEVERVDQGRLMLDRHDFLLVDLIEDITAAQPTLKLVVDMPPGLSLWADRERLEQVLVNLANNAARHGSPPVIISAETDSSGVIISIRDHGPGVPRGDVPYLFERLSSADHSPQSVGLGLWIVRLLTEAHGGSVNYEPAHPGAKFIVRLPYPSATAGSVDSDRRGGLASIRAHSVGLPG